MEVVQSDSMQIDRLIQIVFLLLRHENITAKQLAEELCVSTRTIYRDINILSIAGIPITSQKGYGGGLSLLQGFSLDKSYFTQEEQKNIIQALQILKSSNYPDADKSLNKVAGLFSHNLQSEWLEIDRELPKDFSITPAYKEEYNTPIFVLHFSEKIAYKVYDEFQEKYIKKLDDGTLEVTFRYQLSDWTFLYLLSFGEYVEIIEPVEARNILKEKAKRISDMY